MVVTILTNHVHIVGVYEDTEDSVGVFRQLFTEGLDCDFDFD